MKIIVIGGGPAGMMAAITAREKGHNVVLFEKMNDLGRKLLITGKGRCNITSSLDIVEFIKNTPGNGRFLFSCYQNYNNKDIIDFLKREGLEVKEERGNRIFPVTDKSIDVLNCFKRRLKKVGVIIKYNSKVEKILVKDNKIIGVEIEGKKIEADKVILATGGTSYKLTGSTGDGYKMAKNLGHSIKDIKGSLVPYEVYEKNDCKNLQGLSLKNVRIKIYDNEINKVIYDDFGEMLFTHFGVSGPTIISSSSHLVRYKNIGNKMKNKEITLKIDLKPALTEEKLEERIKRDFEESKNKMYKNSLEKLLPQKLIPIIIERSGIREEKKVNEIEKAERKKLVKLLKELEFTISKFRPVDEAIVTCGGVNIKEINPKTMESKLISGLYFAGEIIDVDAYTGGFNLQIAYSTGYTAGLLE